MIVLEKLENWLDRVSLVTGRAVSSLTLLMVLVTFVIVIMRYVFDAGLIWMQESVTWMHAVVFMLGAAYTLQHEEHVRVDIFYRAMSERRRAWVDAIGVVIFLLPLCAYLAWSSFDYVEIAWERRENSRESGGLVHPWPSLLKSVLILMPLLLSLQGLSLLFRSIRTIRGR